MAGDPFGWMEGQRSDDIGYFTTSGEWRPLHRPTTASVLKHSGSVGGLSWAAFNATGRVYIPAVSFSAAGTGTPAFAVTGGASVDFPNWALDGTADEDVVTEYGMPPDWNAGNITPYIIWRPSDTNTGNVAWRMFINSQAAGTAGNGAIETNSGTVVSAASGTQYGTTIHSMGSLAPGTGTSAPLLRITVYRFASDAADTYNAHDALFCGIYIEYGRAFV